MSEEISAYEIKVGQHGKGCECGIYNPGKHSFLNDIGHTHTCQCVECQDKPAQKNIRSAYRDCDTCSRTENGQCCSMVGRDTDTCLGNPSRPFWVPKPGKTCRTCARRLENVYRVCPLEPDTRDECVRDFWSMWRPVVTGKNCLDANMGDEVDYAWAKKQEKKADQALEFVREAWKPGGDIETDYRPGSTVSSQKDRIKELVDAHWNYQEKLLSAGQDKSQMFTWSQVMEMRKWDYTSSAAHFYGHGYEDAKEAK